MEEVGGIKDIKTQQQICQTRSSSTLVNKIDIFNMNTSSFTLVHGREEKVWGEGRQVGRKEGEK